MSPVVVIGAGLGGLAAAVRLAAAGRDVTIVEAGRCRAAAAVRPTLGEYRFDTGPSVLTMPEVLADVFAAAGQDMETLLPLRRLDPYYRLRYHDGSHLDVVAGEDAMIEQVRALCGTAEADRYRRFRVRLGELFDAEWPAFIDRDMTRLRDLARPRVLARLAALGGFRSLDSLVRSHLTDHRLIKAHTFQALYVGLPPRQGARDLRGHRPHGHRRRRLLPASTAACTPSRGHWPRWRRRRARGSGTGCAPSRSRPDPRGVPGSGSTPGSA